MNVPATVSIDASAENVLSVLRFVSDCRNTNFTADGIIRALYVETLNNLEFLDNLKLDEANTLEKLGFEKLELDAQVESGQKTVWRD